MGTDSGREGEVALATDGGLTPAECPGSASSHLFTQKKRASWAVTGRETEQFGAGRNSWGSHWGVTCSPEWRFRKEAILPAWREGWLGSKPSAPGSAAWPVGKDATALGPWDGVLGRGLRALACHTQAPRSIGRSWEPWSVLKSGSQGPIDKTCSWAGVWPVCVGLVGKCPGAEGMIIYYVSPGTVFPQK